MSSMKIFACVLTDIETQMLEDLSHFYGETNQELLMKLALRKFHKKLFAEDRIEYGIDEDLEQIRGE